jgi:hypothetical protein
MRARLNGPPASAKLLPARNRHRKRAWYRHVEPCSFAFRRSYLLLDSILARRKRPGLVLLAMKGKNAAVRDAATLY